jgi:2'-5' RNA ligase
MFRSFVAVFPPRDVLSRIVALRAPLDLVLPGVRWVGERNLHFTLRFFGDLTREEVDRAARALDEGAAERTRFTITLAGIGVFPDWRRPRVLWIGAGEGSAPLVDLATDLERRFREAGLGKADKPFVPHLTVGRWREPPRALDPERARAVADAAGPLGSFEVEDVRLVRSVLDPKGSIYTVLHAARLGG